MSDPPPYTPLNSPPQGQMPYPPAPQQMPYPQTPQHMPYPQTPQQNPTVVNIQPPVVGQPIVAGHTIVTTTVGNCPACRIGFLQSEFTWAGILLAFFFFPLGVICCLVMQEKRCSHCHATWDH